MTEPAPVRVLDLRGVSCPLNYVKTRVALEKVEPPRSCEEDGFPVRSVDGGDGYARLLVSRTA